MLDDPTQPVSYETRDVARDNPPEGYHMNIRVMIADDHAVVRLGIVKLIELEAGDEIVVVGEMADGNGLAATVASLKPDVLLLDVVMPHHDILSQTREIMELAAPPRVLIMSGYESDEYVLPLIAAGIAGYLLKDENPDVILRAIRAVAEGETWFSQRIAGQIARATYALDAEQSVGAAALTPREWEILQHITQGKSNSEIADQLALSKTTVQNYVSNIYTKLGIATRAQAILYAMRNKLVDINEVLFEE
jgi:DNA-binding NarL/FixJ family response regulator